MEVFIKFQLRVNHFENNLEKSCKRARKKELQIQKKAQTEFELLMMKPCIKLQFNTKKFKWPQIVQIKFMDKTLKLDLKLVIAM